MIKTLISLVVIFAVAVLAHADSPPTVIDSLSIADPIGYEITAPGTYLLGEDLHYPTSDPSTYYAFAINAEGYPPAEGPIVLDLAGHTLSGDGGSFRLGMGANLGISILGSDLATNTVTIENGTIRDFRIGMETLGGSGVTIRNVDFINDGLSVAFGGVKNAVVTDCTFRSGIDFNTGLPDIRGPIGIHSYLGHVRQWDNTFHLSHGGTAGLVVGGATVRWGGPHGNHRIGVVPEANPALVLLPFLLAVVLLSSQAVKPSGVKP